MDLTDETCQTVADFLHSPKTVDSDRPVALLTTQIWRREWIRADIMEDKNSCKNKSIQFSGVRYQQRQEVHSTLC